MQEGPSLAVGLVGAGRLGSALASGLLKAGYDLKAVASTNVESARSLAAALGDDVQPTSDPKDVLARCDLVFLTVPDAAIASLSESLAWESRHLVVHCSGALGLDALAAVRRAGGSVGCLHPLQSFPSRLPDPDRFRGVFCGVEGEADVSTLLEAIVAALGAESFRLEGVDRALYHAAAVFVSNHVVALASAATRAWALAGLPAEIGREALSPLLVAAAQNVTRLELASALTGPVSRADVTTVDAHLRALAGDPHRREIYRLLSVELLGLPLKHPPEATERLRRLLADEG